MRMCVYVELCRLCKVEGILVGAPKSLDDSEASSAMSPTAEATYLCKTRSDPVRILFCTRIMRIAAHDGASYYLLFSPIFSVLTLVGFASNFV